MKINKKKLLSRMMAYILVLLVSFGIIAGVRAGDLTRPEDPIGGQAADSSYMLPIFEANTLDAVYNALKDERVYAPLKVEPEVEPEKTSEKHNTSIKPKTEAPRQTAVSIAQVQSQVESKPLEEPQQEVEAGPGDKGGTGEGNDSEGIDPNGGNGDQTDPPIEPPGDITYFTTSIKNGETVTSPQYAFEIYHKVASLTVNQLDVSVNGILQPGFNGSVLLEEGKNAIKVSVTYVDGDGNIIMAAKTYSVYVNTAVVFFNTNLKDQTVNAAQFSFVASASNAGNNVPMTVTLNGKEVSSSSENYTVQLNEGSNTIVLSASYHGKTAEVSYTIIFEKLPALSIWTDLCDQTVNQAEFSFTAYMENGSPDARFSVYFNGKIIRGNGDQYHVSFRVGSNTIRLVAIDSDGTKISDSYTIRFTRDLADEEDPGTDVPTAPQLQSNLVDGMSLSGSIFTLDITGTDYKGARIYGNNITVKLNGTEVPSGWEDFEKTTYRLDLQEGQNIITILLVDKEGYSAFYKYTIIYVPVGDGEAIGKAIVSIEATTVGLGYLISPVEVPVYNNEPASYVLDRLLRENGFSYITGSNGNLERGFYLAHVLKDGITDGYAIPPDLVDAINANGPEWTNVVHENSLGEFDFCKGSGWMFTINGKYPNMGLSDCYLNDGDVLRIRYTLAFGRDIGGGAALGTGDDQNYPKEW